MTLRGGDIKEPEKGGGEGQEGREIRGDGKLLPNRLNRKPIGGSTVDGGTLAVQDR